MQCELIAKKYGVVHISTGDLLRAEVAASTAFGVAAKEHMEKGELVPDDIVIDMVKARLAEEDARTQGWLLDGYPRSGAQGEALTAAGIEPELFLLLEVPDDVLIARVVGRRMDPATGKIYHVEFNPPPADVPAERLVTRSDDTEEKARTRLGVHAANVGAVRGLYEKCAAVVDGNRAKDAVFADICAAIDKLR
jgi:adenylate kinase